MRHHRAAGEGKLLLTAAAAKLDAGPDQHDVPENAVAVGLAPEHLPAVEMTSECQGGRTAEKLGFGYA